VGDRVKLVQLVSVPQCTPGLSDGMSSIQWAILYALDDEGCVWWWAGTQWMPMSQPEHDAPGGKEK